MVLTWALASRILKIDFIASPTVWIVGFALATGLTLLAGWFRHPQRADHAADSGFARGLMELQRIRRQIAATQAWRGTPLGEAGDMSTHERRQAHAVPGAPFARLAC